jgi:SAM-dependent methyltransferase
MMKSYVQRSAEQLRFPKGFSGLIAARMMKKMNCAAISWTIGHLRIGPHDRVLEIGFGPGYGLKEAVSHIQDGKVEGIDYSPLMMKVASRNNSEAVARGRLRMQQADACELPFENAEFDKVFAINVFYFWEDSARPLSEIHRVLRSGGVVALYIVEKQDMLKTGQGRTEVFRLPTNEEVVLSLEKAGFSECAINKRDEGTRTGVCILARR